MAESGVTVANAFVQVMPSANGIEGNLTKELSSAMETAATSSGKSGGETLGSSLLDQLKGLGSSIAGVGGEVGTSLYSGAEAVLSGAGVAALTAAGVALAGAVLGGLEDIGSEFDGMTDSIVVGTGASGKALDSLTASATEVGNSVPVSFEKAGGIVADFNTRMGLTGSTLTDVSKKTAALGEILGKDININQLTGAMNAFGISGKDVGKNMDYLFGVSQATGIGFDQLTGIVKNAGPAMQSLGFSFKDTADLAGQLDKAGIDANAVMGSMKKALTAVAENGGDVKKTFNDSVKSIEDFIKAGNDAAAIDAAKDIFGARNAPQFVAALKSGAVNMEELGKNALGAKGDIEGTEEATKDWPETWELLQNRIKSALEPLGTAVFSTATAAMEKLFTVVTSLISIFPQFAGFVGSVFAPLTASVQGVSGILSSVFMPIWQTLQDLFNTAYSIIAAQVAPAFDSIQAAISRVASVFTSTFLPALQPVIVLVGAIVGTLITVLIPALGAVVGFLIAEFGTAFTMVANLVTSAMQIISGVIQTVVGVIEAIVGTFVGIFTGNWRMAADGMQRILGGLAGIANGALNAVFAVVQGVLSTISNVFTSIFNGLTGIVSGVFSAIANTISGTMNGAKSTISGALNAIAGFFRNLHLQLPPIKLPHFKASGSFNLDPAHFSLPSIGVEWYAKGGIATRAAVLGEAGAEAIVPYTNSNIKPWATALSNAAGLTNNSDEATGQLVNMLAYYLPVIVRGQETDLTKRDLHRLMLANNIL